MYRGIFLDREMECRREDAMVAKVRDKKASC
jgi:hypothetical protein